MTKHGDCFEQLDHADTHRVNLGVARGLVLECILYLLLPRSGNAAEDGGRKYLTRVKYLVKFGNIVVIWLSWPPKVEVMR